MAQIFTTLKFKITLWLKLLYGSNFQKAPKLHYMAQIIKTDKFLYGSNFQKGQIITTDKFVYGSNFQKAQFKFKIITTQQTNSYEKSCESSEI